jgi:hypothetical protein
MKKPLPRNATEDCKKFSLSEVIQMRYTALTAGFADRTLRPQNSVGRPSNHTQFCAASLASKPGGALTGAM